MTTLTKTLATTAALITLSGAAFADAHAEVFDPADIGAVQNARLDMTLDTDNDDSVSNDEIIEAYMEVFDKDGNGAIDADERGEAETLLGEDNE